MKIGIIGAGAFTDFCLEAYQTYLPEAVFQSITDLSRGNAEKLAAKYQIPSLVADAQELLDDQGLDIILILTPPATHFELAKKAIEAGKHVLVEKPIAFSLAEAETLLKLAAEKKIMMAANLVLRHHPFHQTICEIVTAKKYGQLRHITTTALLAEYPADHWYWDRKISGGFFLNTFCHFLDLYSFIVGQQPTAASSHGNEKNGYLVTSQFRYLSAALNVYLHASNEQERVETTYIFDTAVIRTKGWLPEEMITIHRDGRAIVAKQDDKLDLYKKVLAAILAELIKRVESPNLQSLITNQDLVNAVKIPLLAEQTNH